MLHYCCNLYKKPLKRDVFCIFKGDATISKSRDPIFRNQRPKIHIGKMVWSQYNFEHPKPRFEWTINDMDEPDFTESCYENGYYDSAYDSE